MNKKSQAEILRQLSDHELTVQLVLTQLVLLSIGLISSLYFFDYFWKDWQGLLSITIHQWFLFGILPGLMILLIDIILMYILPKKHYDDGGVNERVFKNRSILSIFLLTLLISVSEEVLFRGVIHMEFGYLVASLLFAVVHIRYLTKPVLLISVLFVSFFIGYMFEITGSLIVTVTAHFIVDVVLGLMIRFGKWGGNVGKES